MTVPGLQSFEQHVVRSHEPVLVHFADGSEASQALRPVLDRLADRLAGRSLVATAMLADHREAAARYGVFSAPALVYFRDGGIAGRKSGSAPVEDELYRWLEGLGIGCSCHPG